jgi:aspartate/methionine/tyrosine aminotransferase
MTFNAISSNLINAELDKLGYNSQRLSIRELKKLVESLEAQSGMQFIRMEFGIPNLPVPEVALKAEVAAMEEREVHRSYPPFDGIPELKEETARFAKNFIGLDVPAKVCIPTCGAMQGGFIAQIMAARFLPGRDTILFLEPGFPVNKLQAKFHGLKTESIDFYNFRGEKLIEEINRRLEKGNIGGVIWSSPNNPSWICLNQDELDGMAEAGDKHNVLMIEDQAYFGMDLRQDYYHSGEPPFVPSVSRKGKNWVILLSGSKLFSYAGQRIGLMILSPTLAERNFENLEPWFATKNFLHAVVHGGIYCITAGVSHSAQWGLTALLKSANENNRGYVENVREYSNRAKTLKKTFLKNGFSLVYDNDLGEPLADGFYFTVSYPGMRGPQLLLELLRYGISMITLDITGSCRLEGLRACVSFTDKSRFADLEERLATFNKDFTDYLN